MTLSTRSVQIKIKSDCDAFHQIWKAKPLETSSLSPATIHNCQLLEGELGTVGCILLWNYFHDGKECVGKTETIEIDEDKKSVRFKIIEGDLLELYKTFETHVQVDSDNLVATWTVTYEKLNPDVPDPDTLMDFYTRLTKDVEGCHLGNK